jgi:hypothetical protein
MVEPPCGVIANRMKAGKVIPFLGAGASFVGRPPGAAWDPERSLFLPSGRELSRFLAQETSFPDENEADKDNLAKVASYYADVNGRPVLRERLRDVLNRDVPCGPIHQLLAEVPAHQVIVVTNYDMLVEKAFQAAGKPYDLVIHPADRKDIASAVLWWPHGAAEPIVRAPNELDIDLARTTVIYKMHGTIDPGDPAWDNFVITEEDYVDFLSRMTANTAVPSLFYEHFRERSFLFLGYSLGDWNLRVILKNLSRLLSPRRGHQEDEPLPSWAIQYHPSELERTLWKNRNVSIFDMTVDDFVQRMRERQGSHDEPR